MKIFFKLILSAVILFQIPAIAKTKLMVRECTYEDKNLTNKESIQFIVYFFQDSLNQSTLPENFNPVTVTTVAANNVVQLLNAGPLLEDDQSSEDIVLKGGHKGQLTWLYLNKNSDFKTGKIQYFNHLLKFESEVSCEPLKSAELK
jgi:hypothetical protein